MIKLSLLSFILILTTLFSRATLAEETFQCSGYWIEQAWQKPLGVSEANGTLSIKLNKQNPNLNTLRFEGTRAQNGTTQQVSVTHFLSLITEAQYVAFTRMMNRASTDMMMRFIPPSFYSYTFNRRQLELRRDVIRLGLNETVTENMGRLSCVTTN